MESFSLAKYGVRVATMPGRRLWRKQRWIVASPDAQYPGGKNACGIAFHPYRAHGTWVDSSWSAVAARGLKLRGAEPRIKGERIMAEQTIEQQAENLTDKARDVGEQAVNKANEAWEKGSEKMQEYTEVATDWVRDNPMYGVMIAFGVGALVGMMIRGRN